MTLHSFIVVQMLGIFDVVVDVETYLWKFFKFSQRCGDKNNPSVFDK